VQALFVDDFKFAFDQSLLPIGRRSFRGSLADQIGGNRLQVKESLSL
jgi:hypothetical protein